jgi:prepilin-type processing-associated H-X9-DG protein
VKMDASTLEYVGPKTPRIRPHLVTLPPRVTKISGILALTLCAAGAFFLSSHNIIRSYNPHWWQWVTPLATAVAFPLALLACAADAHHTRRAFALGILGLVCASGLALGMVLLPRVTVCGESADRVKCASNLRQIGQALLIYANANSNVLPPDLPTLFRSSELTAEVMVCPISRDHPARGAHADVAAEMTGPPNCSYKYRGSGLINPISSGYVVAYEPPSNHSGDGANALFGDGHVEFLTPKALQGALAVPATAPTTNRSTSTPTR